MRRFEPGPRCRLAALLALGVCLSAPAAQAEDPGQDEVSLKGGGSIRGTIVVVDPGKEVEIAVMGEGQPRVVPWSDVELVRRGKYAPLSSAPLPQPSDSASPPPPPPPPPRGPTLGDPGVVRIHIDSPAPVTLLQRQGITYPVTESWVDGFGNIVTRDAMGRAMKQVSLCTSPCDRAIRAFNLHIAGKGFPSSSTFDFDGKTGDVTIQVRPGNDGEYYGGIAAIVVGSLAAVAGAIILPLNQKLSTTTDLNTGAKVHVPDPALRTAGIGLTAGGVVALAGGIVMVLVGRTTLTFSQQTGAAPRTTKPQYWMGEF